MSADNTTAAKSKYVRLISNDDHEFVVERALAKISPIITAMMEGPTADGDEGEAVPPVYFKGIDSATMSYVCKYFMYRNKYSNSGLEIPQFDMNPDIAPSVLNAAQFLEC